MIVMAMGNYAVANAKQIDVVHLGMNESFGGKIYKQPSVNQGLRVRS
jgi:hypothetical protein